MVSGDLLISIVNNDLIIFNKFDIVINVIKDIKIN